MSRMRILLFGLGTAVMAVACSDQPAGTPAPSFTHVFGEPLWNHVILCKTGSSGTFDIVNGDVTNASLADGECQEVDTHPGDASFMETVTITETSLPAGVVLDQVVIDRYVQGALSSSTTEPGPTVSVDTRDDVGYLVTYENLDITANGRMTGGGGQIRIDGVRITRGLTIHCDITLSNNLEINWTGGNKWHIDKPLTSAQCIDDPAIDPVPPAAPFDTFIGEGVGRLNGEDGSFVRFTFVDDGEPGRDDHATIAIWAPGADPNADTPVLQVSAFLDHGNLQAHFDQPHK
jgi:hypothetical protein